MVAQFGRTVQTKSLGLLPFNTLVDEVGCLMTPVLRSLNLLQNYLLGYKRLAIGFPIVGGPRLAPLHQLVCDDTDLKVVAGRAMILTQHHLRRDVAWMTGRVGVVTLLPDPC